MTKVRWAGALLLAIGAVAVGGCGDDDSSGKGGAAAGSGGKFGSCKTSGPSGDVKLKTVTPGKLTVETLLPPSGPGWFNGETPTSIQDGFEYCLAAQIAHRAGLEQIVIKPVTFEALVAGRSKGYDVAMAEVYITPERQQVVDFSRPYFKSQQALLTKKDSDLGQGDLATAKLGLIAGSLGATWARKNLPGAKFRVYQAQADLSAAVAAGQVDAGVDDVPLVLGAAQGAKGTFKVPAQLPVGADVGAIFPKGSPNKAPFDRLIAAAEQDGTLKQLDRKSVV